MVGLFICMLEVPQRQQLASEDSVPETPSYGTEYACRAQKRLPTVRDAFSEAFGVKNRLLRYGRDIRCAEQASVVRDASSKARRTAPAAPDASSVRGTASARRRANIKRGCSSKSIKTF